MPLMPCRNLRLLFWQHCSRKGTPAFAGARPVPCAESGHGLRASFMSCPAFKRPWASRALPAAGKHRSVPPSSSLLWRSVWRSLFAAVRVISVPTRSMPWQRPGRKSWWWTISRRAMPPPWRARLPSCRATSAMPPVWTASSAVSASTASCTSPPIRRWARAWSIPSSTSTIMWAACRACWKPWSVMAWAASCSRPRRRSTASPTACPSARMPPPGPPILTGTAN